MLEGQPVPSEVPAIIVDGHTLLPLRAVAESAGLQVAWDNPNKTVHLSWGGNPAPEVLRRRVKELQDELDAQAAARLALERELADWKARPGAGSGAAAGSGEATADDPAPLMPLGPAPTTWVIAAEQLAEARALGAQMGEKAVKDETFNPDEQWPEHTYTLYNPLAPGPIWVYFRTPFVLTAYREMSHTIMPPDTAWTDARWATYAERAARVSEIGLHILSGPVGDSPRLHITLWIEQEGKRILPNTLNPKNGPMGGTFDRTTGDKEIGMSYLHTGFFNNADIQRDKPAVVHIQIKDPNKGPWDGRHFTVTWDLRRLK